MLLNGVMVPGGPVVTSLHVAHGQDPIRQLWLQGFSVVRPLSAAVTASDDVALTFQVAHKRPSSKPPRPRSNRRKRALARGRQTPAIKQRLACYGIVLSSKGVLATRYARTTSVSGMWGLPGGGREATEAPSDTVLREIVEETGQQARIERLLDLQSDHWIGRSPRGVLEDFHALRLIYFCRTDSPTIPVVHDVGGTTAAATWVPLRRWRTFKWANSARALLTAHLPQLTSSRR